MRWSTYACPQCLSLSVAGTWMLRRPAILHRHLPYHTIPYHTIPYHTIPRGQAPLGNRELKQNTSENHRHPLFPFRRLDKMVLYGMVWYGMVWYGMVTYVMSWHGIWHGIRTARLLAANKTPKSMVQDRVCVDVSAVVTRWPTGPW